MKKNLDKKQFSSGKMPQIGYQVSWDFFLVLRSYT